MSYAYDAVGRLASIAAPNGETIAFTYDAGGRLIEQRLHSGLRTTLSWFEDGSLKARQNLHGSTVLSSHLYTLDPQGRRATHAENIGGTTKNWAYQYDQLDRLTSASDGTAESYSYDLFGNRRSKTKSGTTTAYLFDAAHQLSEIRNGSDTGPLIGAAIHDADGHLIKLCEVTTGGTVTKTASDCTATGSGATVLALTWNALDQLLTATRSGAGALTESYQYDDQGRRISKVSGTTTTSYLYDGDAIHAEWSGSTISGLPQAAYVHGAGIDQPLLRLTGTTNSPSATQSAYLQDGLGSVIGTASPTGTLTASQRFDAWGNRTAGTGTVPQYGYTGREPDQTGLVYYRARYYHPGLGRFLSRDPAGMVDAVSPYAYVANSPTNYVDPTGEFLMQAAGAIVGGLGGLFFQAGADLYHGNLSSFSEYAGSVVGGAAGGVAATVCGPACAGAAAGALSNLTTQAVRGDGFSNIGLAVDTAFGAIGGKVVGTFLPTAAKAYLSNQTKGAIGEGLSELGIRTAGQSIAKRAAPNGVGKSTFDFELSNGKYVESKFGTSRLSGPQRTAAREQGENLDVHYWDYPTLSGLAASGPVAALGFGSDVSVGAQSLDAFTSRFSLLPYSGGATNGFDVRQFK